MSGDDPAIILKNVSKTFRIPVDKATGLKQAIVRFSKQKRGFRDFHVLSDITFDVKKGEFFGIVGRNGSGKSTLLKLMSGIYVPDEGLIQVNGTLTPFIELGVGFNPELTGRENVFLNGALLGFDRKEIEAMYVEIVHFAELEDFMEEKLKNFSSGMQVRLAFSIAIRSRSEILIMDEVLAVGDADFQKKCFNMFRELKKQGRTIILVTHDMGNVERFCDRVLILNKGEVLTITTPKKAATIYSQLNINDDQSSLTTEEKEGRRWGKGGLTIKKLSIETANKGTAIIEFKDRFHLTIQLHRERTYESKPFAIGLAFINQDGVTVTGPNSQEVTLSEDAQIVSYTVDHLPLQPGDYKLTVAIIDKETDEVFDFYNDAISFHVVSDKPPQGVMDMEGAWVSQ
jgi:ABC-2 type transport system ATP-binding protein